MRRSEKDLLELKAARQMLDRLTNIQLDRLAHRVGIWPRGVTDATRLAMVNALMMVYGRAWRYRDGCYMVRDSELTVDVLDRPVDGVIPGGTP